MTAFILLSLATLTPAPTLSKLYYPSPCTITLASLVKGRWIDGKAQTVALLRFNCDTPAFFIYQTFLPSRRRDCHIEPLHSHNLLKSTSTASPRTKLTSLVKGEVLSPEKILATTGGIALHPPTSPSSQPS